MKVQYSHQLITSFYYWLDHMLLEKAEAFENKTGLFYNYSDVKHPSNSIYGSPHAQFVYDSSISGANVISGVYDDSQNFIGRGTSGLKIDYKNGRSVFDTNNSNLNISGEYSVKDFNLYLDSREEKFIFEEAFNLTKEKVTRPISYVSPYKIVAPCAVIKYNVEGENKPYALGGEDRTETTIKVIFISDNSFKLDGAMSALSDRNKTCFANITDWDDLPFNYYGDLKSGSYNYNEMAQKYSSDVIYIDKVFSSRIMEGKNIQNKDFSVGYLEFDVGKLRFPRQ